MKRLINSLLLITLFAFGLSASAATPAVQATITWRAATITPAWYIGKAMPNSETPIEAELLLTSANRIESPSVYTIKWFESGSLIAGGRGLSRITIDPKKTYSTTLQIKATVTTDDGTVVAEPTTIIERARPKVVIEIPALDRRVTRDPVTLTALPFFFSLTPLENLFTRWMVDGISVSSDSQLTVAATGTTLPTAHIEALIENTVTNFESGMKAITLFPTQ